MPAITNITLATNLTGTLVPAGVYPVSTTPGKTSEWSDGSFPELGRITVHYSYRKPNERDVLARHTFKFDMPTLKSVVTDPSGPYVPPPILDYMTVAEMNFYVHPRATAAERDRAAAIVLRSMQADSSLQSLIMAVLNGQSIY